MIEPGIRHRRGRVRVEQAEHDHVEAVVAGREERAGVVVDQRDPRGVVRLLRVVAAAQVDDLRVDLDRRDLLDSVPQRARRVVTRAGPHQQHFPGLRVEQERDVILAQSAHRGRILLRVGGDVALVEIDHRLIARVVDQ